MPLFEGLIEKMRTQLPQGGAPVQYRLPMGEEEIPVNALIGSDTVLSIEDCVRRLSFPHQEDVLAFERRFGASTQDIYRVDAATGERTLLAEGLTDPAIRALYGSLLASEARHHGLFLELASRLVGRAEAEARLAELAAHEAAVVAAPCEWVRLHAG